MAATMRTGAEAVLRRRVLAACEEGVPVAAVPRPLAEALATAVPYHELCWGALDPTTLLPVTNATLHRPAPRIMTAVYENEYVEPDVNKFSFLARARSPVGVLSAATRGELSRSPRYRRVVQPLGYADELRALLRLDGVCWGYVVLFRDASAPPFTAGEAAFLDSVIPDVAGALRTALLHESRGGEAVGAPGLIVLDHTDAVQALNAEAAALLEADATDVLRASHLPAVIYTVAAAARAAADASLVDPPPAYGRLRTPSGHWLLVQGTTLTERSGGRQTTVVLQPTPPSQLAPLLLAPYELTSREAKVALCVVRGLTTAQVAAALCITPYTVQDHLKVIFDKVGVRSRRDLMAALLFSQGLLGGHQRRTDDDQLSAHPAYPR